MKNYQKPTVKVTLSATEDILTVSLEGEVQDMQWKGLFED